MTEEPQPRRREPVEVRSARVAAVDYAERTIELIAVPYEEETVVPWRDGTIRESIEPGAFLGIEERNDHVTVNRDHDYSRTVGRVVDYRHDDPRGLIAKVYVSDTPLGDETLRLADDGVLKASVGMVVRRSDQIVRGGLRRIKRAFLDHIALLPNPAYKGAGVLAVRHDSAPPSVIDEPATPLLDEILGLLEG